MFELSVTIATAADAQRAAAVFARIAAAYGAPAPAIASGVADTTTRRRNPKATEASPDPETTGAAQTQPPAHDQDKEQIETAMFAEPVASPVSFDEKCTKLRALGRPHGVTWLRGVMKDNAVERLSDLPEAKIDELIVDLERGAAN